MGGEGAVLETENNLDYICFICIRAWNLLPSCHNSLFLCLPILLIIYLFSKLVFSKAVPPVSSQCTSLQQQRYRNMQLGVEQE